MKVFEILEGYDKDHKCKTPGAIYSTSIHGRKITTKVNLPSKIDFDLTEKESDDLEAEIHYALEKVLKKFF